MNDHPIPGGDGDAGLAELKHHWGDAYTIISGRDGYQAKRRDGRGGWLMAGTAAGLFALIHADYAARPVPRDCR